MSEKIKIATIEFTPEEWESVRSLAQKKNKKAELDALTQPSILRLALGLEAKKRGGARPNTGNRLQGGAPPLNDREVESTASGSVNT